MTKDHDVHPGMLKSGIFLAFLFALLLTLPSLSYGQVGKVTGRVTDAETDQPLPGVNVLIVSRYLSGRVVELDEKLGAATDENGYFIILNVPPGIYNVESNMIGYSRLIKQQVHVNADLTTSVNFPLTTAPIAGETVEVVAERNVIRPDVTGTQEIVQTQRLNETPVLRVDEFMGKVRGVDLVANEEGQGLSIRGGQIRETDIRMDGISLRDPRSGNSYLALNSTAVEELQLLTGGFEAKYGGIRSGLVNVITKTGSRDRYNFSLKVDYTLRNQKKYFGSDPWGKDGWIYKVFADTSFKYFDPRSNSMKSFAMDGVPQVDSLLPAGFPEDEFFHTFKGWNNLRQQLTRNGDQIGIPAGTVLTPAQRLAVWQIQHPAYHYAGKPDQFIEGSMTGPVPGSFLPLIGPFAENSTFLLAAKYENTQFAFPVAPRNNYLDWNTQLKITTQISTNSKLSISGMYASINTVTAGRPSNYGGALIDNSSRFNFLSNSQEAVNQQAQLLAGANGIAQMFNKSRLQFYDQRYLVGGLKFSQNLSSRSFYTLEYQFNYTDHTIKPFAFDIAQPDAWIQVDSTLQIYNVPRIGTPRASTNFGYDIADIFTLYGGLQQADTSSSWVSNFAGNLTSQIGEHHQIETGLNFTYYNISVNSGTWSQAQKSWTPDTWQYFTATPLEMGAYIQDKLEYQGFVGHVGLRMDYFNPLRKSYIVKHPLDPDYANFYNITYQYLPGDFGSWEKWQQFRDMLANPPGWPSKPNPGQLALSPRLGVSFPVTINSKMYFNYGHFYQRPNIHFVYDENVMPGATLVPSTDLPLAKTVSYEFGYEQRFFQQFLINVSMYYKNVDNEPLGRNYVNYTEELSVSKYFPDAYRDIRGVEVRFERSYGRYLSFWSTYEYMVTSSGQSGLAHVYENQLLANNEQRDANYTTSQPLPKAQGNINLHTPGKFGPRLFGLTPLADIYLNFYVEWRDGGEQVINPTDPEPEWKKIQILDYSNVDLRASKTVKFEGLEVEIVATIQNLLNKKRLAYWNMSSDQYDRYKQSLHLPFESGEQHGNDKLGTWNKEYIDIGWFTAPLFLNPRRVLLGLRINF